MSNKKEKIVIIGDSLTLPRGDLSYESTWVYKLKNNTDYEIITILKRGITTNVLTQWGGDGKKEPKGADCLEFYQPDIIILQLGIVDCSPRLFKEGTLEKKIITQLPDFIREKYIKLIKKTRKRKSDRVDVDIDKFKSIHRKLEILKKQNKIKRIGPDKGGYWQVIG